MIARSLKSLLGMVLPLSVIRKWWQLWVSEAKLSKDVHLRDAVYDFKYHGLTKYFAYLLNVHAPSEHGRVPQSHLVAAQLSFDEFHSMIQEDIDEIYQAGDHWMTRWAHPIYQALVEREFKSYANQLYYYRLFTNRMGISDSHDLVRLLALDINVDHYIVDICEQHNTLLERLTPGQAAIVEEGEVGTPMVINHRGRRISGDLIRLGFYYADLARWLDSNTTGPIVFVLGAGYGEMARLIHKSIRDSTIVLIDLPLTLAIATYYLKANFPGADFLTYSDLGDTDLSRETLNQYDFVLLPNFEIAKFAPDSVDLAINISSLGEMEPEVQSNYMQYIERIAFAFFSANRTESRYMIDGTVHTNGFQYEPGQSWTEWDVVRPNPMKRGYGHLFIRRNA